MGFLWTDPAFRQLLAPSGTWLSVEDGTDFSRPATDFQRAWLEDGRKLEPGSPNVLGCAGLLEALRTLHVPGIPAIATHVKAMQARLLEALARQPAWTGEARRLQGLLELDRLGPILSFHHGHLGPKGLRDLLTRGFRQGVFASEREGYLRIALHGWHDAHDVDRVVDWLSGSTS
jgi:selenocysteine lyase/cysteine desulfurase